MALVVRRAQTEDWPCNTKDMGGPDKSSFRSRDHWVCVVGKVLLEVDVEVPVKD